MRTRVCVCACCYYVFVFYVCVYVRARAPEDSHPALLATGVICINSAPKGHKNTRHHISVRNYCHMHANYNKNEFATAKHTAHCKIQKSKRVFLLDLRWCCFWWKHGLGFLLMWCLVRLVKVGVRLVCLILTLLFVWYVHANARDKRKMIIPTLVTHAHDLPLLVDGSCALCVVMSDHGGYGVSSLPARAF